MDGSKKTFLIMTCNRHNKIIKNQLLLLPLLNYCIEMIKFFKSILIFDFFFVKKRLLINNKLYSNNTKVYFC